MDTPNDKSRLQGNEGDKKDGDKQDGDRKALAKKEIRKRLIEERKNLPDRAACAAQLQQVMRIWLVGRKDEIGRAHV